MLGVETHLQRFDHGIVRWSNGNLFVEDLLASVAQHARTAGEDERLIAAPHSRDQGLYSFRLIGVCRGEVLGSQIERSVDYSVRPPCSFREGDRIAEVTAMGLYLLLL